MNFNENKYMPRLVDEKIEKYLQVFGVISVEGPKCCGKTWSASKHANSIVYLDDEEIFEKASVNIDMIINEEKPELIDEWTKIPKVWDVVRRKCDFIGTPGNYILTCSTELNEEKQKEIFHSGAGRIGKINMYPMSLYESGDSTGEASIMNMYNKTQKDVNVKVPSLEKIISLILRGGWSSNINVPENLASLLPSSYIEAILSKDINDDKNRDKNKMKMLLKSLARNESSIASNQTLLKDIEDASKENDILKGRDTISDYLDVLYRLYIIDYQELYSLNYRSPERVGKSPKRHFVDPSLACAVLELDEKKLIDDFKTFGFMFELLAERDLKIYANYLDGHLYHFRDNVSGLEIDSILEFKGGEYAAIEIKLGNNKVEEAKENSIKFSKSMDKKPKFMCVITANTSYVGYDKENNIYVLPITSLRP